MSPQPLVKGGLQTWIDNKPLGATWDTEKRRADVLSFDPMAKTKRYLPLACETASASLISQRPFGLGAL
jgi:hypothetical protein